MGQTDDEEEAATLDQVCLPELRLEGEVCQRTNAVGVSWRVRSWMCGVGSRRAEQCTTARRDTLEG